MEKARNWELAKQLEEAKIAKLRGIVFQCSTQYATGITTDIKSTGTKGEIFAIYKWQISLIYKEHLKIRGEKKTNNLIEKWGQSMDT